MGAERLDDVPHRLERRVVECDFGVRLGVDEHRNDDGPDGLVLGLADRPSDRLHDVHLGAAGVDERHTVQRRNIDTFGQAAGVGQQTALPVVELRRCWSRTCRSPAVISPEACCVHSAPFGRWRAGIHAIDLGHLGGELAGAGDAGVEADDAAKVVLPHRFRQSDLARQGPRVGDLLPSRVTRAPFSAHSR